MPVIVLPLVGLIWETDFDPTTMGGVAAPLGQFLIRTDTSELYYKSGLADTAWTALSGGGGGGGTIIVQNETVALPGNPYATLNFESGVKSLQTGGVATIRSAVATATLTFRPGSGESGPEVFDTWDDLYDKLVQLRTNAAGSGGFVIVLDDEDAAVSIPSNGTSYDMANVVEWRGINGASPRVAVEIGDGSGADISISGLAQITGLTITTAQTTPPLQCVDAVLTLISTEVGDNTNEVIFLSGGLTALRLGDDALLSELAVSVVDNPMIDMIGVVNNVDTFTIGENSITGTHVTVRLKEGSGTINTTQPGLADPLGWLAPTDSQMQSLAWPFLPPYAPELAVDVVTLAVGYVNLVPNADVDGGIVAQLPAASGYTKGDFIAIKLTPDAAVPTGVFVTPDGADTIDGVGDYTMDADYEWLVLASNGVNGWYIISTGPPSGTATAPIPEQWCKNNVPANTAATAMDAQLSTNFGTYRAIRAGSLTGLSWRFSETITAGQITLTVRKNGVAVTLAGISTAASNQNGGQTSQAAGVDTFVAGDLFDITYTTNAGFLPITTDVEAVLDAVFAAP